MPVTETRWARRSSALAWKRSLIWRSSRSRPTNGASRPAPLSVPCRPDVDAERPPERHRLRLALQLVLARRGVRDGGLGRTPGGLADEDAAWLGGGLDARGGVDEVARDHALALGADRDRRLAGEHPGTRTELRRADLVAQRGNRRHEVEPDTYRALGVVLGRGRRPPDRHDRVADELLDRAAVELDQPPARVEVAREKLAHLLGVARLRERGEADQVGEEDGDEPAFGGRRLAAGVRGLSREFGAALAAEALPGLVRSPARGAGGGQRAAALGAELAPFAVRRSAARAGHPRERTAATGGRYVAHIVLR